MRLWHKDLISVLPRQQLLSQWRECCCIAKNIATNGTPNHILVNKVLEYPIVHFVEYTNLILEEMNKRNYKVSESSYLKFVNNMNLASKYFSNNKIILGKNYLFRDWHNKRYLIQCFNNLQEKYDCGGISGNEYKILEDFVNKFLGEN